MAHLLNASSQLQCPHGGSVSITTTNTKAKADGGFIVRSSDTFTISGCPFTLPAPVGPHPCVRIQWLTTAMKVKADNNPALTRDSSGLCLAADSVPQGSVMVVNTQTKASGS